MQTSAYRLYLPKIYGKFSVSSFFICTAVTSQVSATLVFELAVVANASRKVETSEFDDVFRSVYFVLFYLFVGSLGLWVFCKTHDAALSGPEVRRN